MADEAERAAERVAAVEDRLRQLVERRRARAMTRRQNAAMGRHQLTHGGVIPPQRRRGRTRDAGDAANDEIEPPHPRAPQPLKAPNASNATNAAAMLARPAVTSERKACSVLAITLCAVV